MKKINALCAGLVSVSDSIDCLEPISHFTWIIDDAFIFFDDLSFSNAQSMRFKMILEWMEKWKENT